MPPARNARSLLFVLILGSFAAGSAETGPAVKVLEAYTAPTNHRQKSAEVYARFVNVETNDRLVGADSTFCERVEFVAADGTTRPFGEFRLTEDVETGFREGAPHLHLVGLRRPLVRGQSFLVTLHFEDGGALPLKVSVQ